MIDLRNTQEEALNVAELKSNQEHDSPSKKHEPEVADYRTKTHQLKNEDRRRSSFNSEKSMDQEDDEDKETQYRLDPK